MPVKIKSVGKGKYRVSTPSGTKAKSTTKAKAERQKRLLNAIDHGWKPTGKPPKKSSELIILKYILKLSVVIGRVLLYKNLFLTLSYETTTLFNSKPFKFVLTSFTFGFPSCKL